MSFIPKFSEDGCLKCKNCNDDGQLNFVKMKEVKLKNESYYDAYIIIFMCGICKRFSAIQFYFHAGHMWFENLSHDEVVDSGCYK